MVRSGFLTIRSKMILSESENLLDWRNSLETIVTINNVGNSPYCMEITFNE